MDIIFNSSMVIIFFFHKQCQSWPILMQGYDMIGIAQVGVHDNPTVKVCYKNCCSLDWNRKDPCLFASSFHTY